MLPLIEAKMLHHFDHRWATYESDGTVRDVTLNEKRDPAFVVMPRYWVPEDEVVTRLAGRWEHGCLLGWRDICRSTDERTTIVALFPRTAVGHTVPLALSTSSSLVKVLSANLSAMCLDYVSRQKVGGMHLTYNYLEQLPVLAPPAYAQVAPWAAEQSLADWIDRRVLELSYSANDMKSLATDLGNGPEPPFMFDLERRSLIRAELDAAYFHLYGLDRTEVEHVLSTFPILQRKDIAAHGEYRTKRVILECFDVMSEAVESGVPYVSLLAPTPGSGPRHVEVRA